MTSKVTRRTATCGVNYTYQEVCFSGDLFGNLGLGIVVEPTNSVCTCMHCYCYCFSPVKPGKIFVHAHYLFEANGPVKRQKHVKELKKRMWYMFMIC